MSNFKRHIGKITTTGNRCVVVFMQIPGKEDHALIVNTDSLPERLHDPLMSVVESIEGQNTIELHNLLARRLLPDLGVDILNALHQASRLQAVPVNQIMMYPTPNNPIPLQSIIDVMNGSDKRVVEDTLKSVNHHLDNLRAEEVENKASIARNLIVQAEQLEAEARRKREQAYNTYPPIREQSVVPNTMTTPVEQNASQMAVQSNATPQVLGDLSDIDPDIASDVMEVQRLLEAQNQQVMESVAKEEKNSSSDQGAHAIVPTEERLDEFLKRAAEREDSANKAAMEAQKPKRPVGRPRKDGKPAGSVRDK